jgi:hypothetical protein
MKFPSIFMEGMVNEKKEYNRLSAGDCLVHSSVPRSAWSFSCSTRKVDVPVPASTFTNKRSAFTLPSGIIRNCAGSVDGTCQDAMRVKTVRYHSSLSGFTRTLQVTGGRSSVSTGATAVASAQTIKPVICASGRMRIAQHHLTMAPKTHWGYPSNWRVRRWSWPVVPYWRR